MRRWPTSAPAPVTSACASLTCLAARAKREQLPNLLAVQAAPDDPRLPQKVDLVLLVDTYHHLGDPVRYFSALKQGLAPQGRVAIIDFTMSGSRSTA